jgi:predicted RNA methylase
MHMRLRDLEARLQRVKPFDTRLQKIELEQFPTGPEIASRLVYTASSSFDDIEGKVVVDLGTGTGRLGIGCALMGASLVIGIDADMDALAIAQKNIDEAEVQMELLLSDVSTMPLGSLIGKVDTVVMNPPFGTRNKGIDVAFLKQALHLQPRAIYSLHKTSTRKFLINKAQSEWGLEVEVLAELRFDIPKVGYRMAMSRTSTNAHLELSSKTACSADVQTTQKGFGRCSGRFYPLLSSRLFTGQRDGSSHENTFWGTPVRRSCTGRRWQVDQH